MFEWLSWPLVAIIALVAFIAYRVLDWSLLPRDTSPVVVQIGDLTIDALGLYCGVDLFRPILLAVKGQVYDVTTSRSLYGPDGQYHVFAGRECSRALAMMSTDEKDCSNKLDDLNEQQKNTLEEWIVKFKKYPVVGKIVPPIEISLDDLRKYDGSDESLPMYLAIQGVIFDVSKAKQFYGPDGMYPFAGHEAARALALFSEDPNDFTSNLEGLGTQELDELRGWEERFRGKYHIVGRIIDKK